MKCQQFNETLQALLDGTLETLPSHAEMHMQSCKSCQVLYRQMLALQRAVRETSLPRLSPQGEAILTQRIAVKHAKFTRPVQMPSLWHTLLNIFTALRWVRVLLAGALVAAGLVIILQFIKPSTPEVTHRETGSDLEILLEEHTMAMDSGIFQGSTQYANFVSVSEEE